MLGIRVKKDNGKLIIKWQLSTIEIPLDEIIEVTEDETYGGKKAEAIRIGTPYATTDRILIRTTKQDYILFSTNKSAILKQLNS
ncbi:SunI/YnzG family protein [Priestia flexa]|uniref:Sublancin immunity protein SunI-like PH domain-containing protein n=1 Tax=Priestia flexa TaxID=86664 RepID=A0ABU4J9M6_9BACI|nr:hypothetical protein [Priestia flexa]MBY6088530.1 hypothetical protein [Priestia flexa]MCM3068154.1 hypothetical protein [Priestia flexa]MDW8517684.1 hypothetical protein [Priestia flexa]MED3826013.1 hypothetical protein [Priestia flexa]